jgi:hypothetical protein
MPLGRIHYCLITTSKYKHILNKEMKLSIEKATTVKVNLEFEQWK